MTPEEWKRAYEAEYPRAVKQVERRIARLRAARAICACGSVCGKPATKTENSPYMDEFCDDCTYHRCDVAATHVD